MNKLNRVIMPDGMREVWDRHSSTLNQPKFELPTDRTNKSLRAKIAGVLVLVGAPLIAKGVGSADVQGDANVQIIDQPNENEVDNTLLFNKDFPCEIDGGTGYKTSDQAVEECEKAQMAEPIAQN